MVIESLSDAEALKVAMNLEEGGIKFYRQMMAKVGSEDTRRALARLAEDEEEHLETFRAIHDEVFRELSPESIYPSPLFSSLVHTSVFDTL